MPELPDVERFKKYLDATALHQKLRTVEVRDADVLQHVSARKLRSHLQGQEFESTMRHGKFLFVLVSSPPLLVLHFGMTGYLDYARQDSEPPKHTRVLFHFANEYWLAYVSQRKLGLVTLTDDAEDFVQQQEMGPDALDDRLTFAQFRQRLEGRRGRIKPALMNQSILAGVGNVYADETLFQAGIAPDRSVADVDETELRELYRAMQRVLKTAIRRHADPEQLPQSYLLRHRDFDGCCPRCGGEFEKIKVSGRGAWFCPRCQK